MIWNPWPHMQHAWDEVHTNYGKAALIVFYSWVWLNILGALVYIVFPTLAVECFFNQLNDTGKAVMKAAVRGLNVFFFGFLGYADVGGLHVKNVAYVFVIATLFSASFLPIVSTAKEIGCESDVSYGIIVLCPGIFGLALVLAIIDKRLGGGGSSDESTPLVT